MVYTSNGVRPAEQQKPRLKDALDGSRETLVSLGVVVLESDLQLDGLEELAGLLFLGELDNLADRVANGGNLDFAHVGVGAYVLEVA